MDSRTAAYWLTTMFFFIVVLFAKSGEEFHIIIGFLCGVSFTSLWFMNK